MARFLAFDVLAFLLPFGLYAIWLLATRRKVGSTSEWPLKTVAWLALAGAVVLLFAIAFFIHLDSGKPGTIYVPARIENGVIVPGHFE
ncbi:MAG TPA: DUF6111 family protein [Bauldia sp.]|nr:DUF6111 family protein [Bauldia sp.]